MLLSNTPVIKGAFALSQFDLGESFNCYLISKCDQAGYGLTD